MAQNFLEHPDTRIVNVLYQHLAEATIIQSPVPSDDFSLESRFNALSNREAPQDVAALLLGEYENYGLNKLKMFLLKGYKACPQFTERHKEKTEVETVAMKHLHGCLRIVRNLMAIGKSADVIALVQEKLDGNLQLHYEPVLTVLSLCSIIGEKAVRQQVYDIVLKMCFNCPRLFYFVACSESFRHLLGKNGESESASGKPKPDKRIKSWEPMRRKMISNFYNKYEPLYLLYLTTRHKQRYKITHRKILGKSRPKPHGEEQEAIDLVLCYLSRGFKKTKEKFEKKEKENLIQPKTSLVYKKIELLDEIKHLQFNQTNIDKLKVIIQQNIKPVAYQTWEGLDRPSTETLFFNVLLEHTPNKFFRKKEIWRHLLPGMPIGTLIFKLGVMSCYNVFDDSDQKVSTPAAKKDIEENIGHAVKIIKEQKDRLHPFKILKAAKCYGKGQSDVRVHTRKIAERKLHRAPITWTPCSVIEDALYEAFQSLKVNEKCASKRKILFVLDNRKKGMYEEQLQGCCSLSPIDSVNILLNILWKPMAEKNEVAFFGDHGDVTKFKMYEENKLKDLANDLKEKSVEYGTVDLIKTIKYAKRSQKAFDAIVVFTDEKPEFDTRLVINEWASYKNDVSVVDCKMALVCLNECLCFDFGRDDMMLMCGWDENSFSQVAEFLQ